MTEKTALQPSHEPYLEATSVVNFKDPAVAAQAKDLAQGLSTALAVIGRCFTWVRDEITQQR